MRNSLLAASIVTVAVAVASVVGIVFASASSGSVPTEHFTILSTKASGNGWVASRGPIHAPGKDTKLSNSKDRFTYAKGTLIVVHHRVGKPTQSFDRKSCLAIYHERGTYKIARGTAEYKNATGHGTYRVTVKAIGCSPKQPPLVIEQDVEASGPLSL